MNNGYILALDQSTSASKAMIVNREGLIVAQMAREHKQHYPKPGWVEHDPIEIYQNVKGILVDVLKKANISSTSIDVLAITNQRETVVVWDKDTGIPVYNAIVWQCRRTQEICSKLKEQGLERMVKDRTGLLLDPYFSATKVKWILENGGSPLIGQAQAGKLLMGTIDTWLIWKLTGGKVHGTDYTNASRTLLFNIKTLQWDDDLLTIFNIPKTMMAEIKSSNATFGYTEAGELFPHSIPISGVIGDSQAALFGQNCFEPGSVKATYGTGSSVLMNIGSEYKVVGNGLVTSIAWVIDGKVEYVLEGIVHCSGDSLKWLKDELGIFTDFSKLQSIAESIEDNEGVYMVPAFVGLGVPYWDADARAAILGMSRRTGKQHIIRAALESIVYQIKDAIETMQAESGIYIKELRVDGGPTENSFLMQFQADMLNIQVARTKVAELSVMGAVYMAGLGIGIWNRMDLEKLRQVGECYTPMMEGHVREQYYQGWKEAVARVLTK
ncbi:glycerol kinase GlpK [Pelosinus sp. UFO1]|uniref:glycerol kinase GlpK n=1 Tax=Pelosinus sp. UFO1 TaxID=484770 RepID=UPI0004D1DC21|nr:glycerol kinase GlpK [Pelosinus sp. UFO1]AIF51349.1 glycerol kinase [Pelosinus sp. UFO1]